MDPRNVSSNRQDPILFPGYTSPSNNPPTMSNTSTNSTSETSPSDEFNLSAGSSSTELYRRGSVVMNEDNSNNNAINNDGMQFDILAEAAKRAEMSLLIQDFEEL